MTSLSEFLPSNPLFCVAVDTLIKDRQILSARIHGEGGDMEVPFPCGVARTGVKRSVVMKEEEVRTLVEAIEDPAEQNDKDKKPREPPIVFRELIPEDEYSRLKSSLGSSISGSPEDQQALSELNEYIVKDEGAWALSDETIHYIGKLLHDKSISPKIRSNLLRLLATAALKDDIILMLHQDRKEHLLMNYAVDIEHLPEEEQDGLALFICNLFESTSSSEWLLYISEWAYDRQTLSNARVTTKVAVSALLSPNEGIRDKGTAIMHNLASKEVKSAVFDDIATELSMAILQFLTTDPQE
ncbi:unnamed protein product, partial [Cyprideis torosa]